MLYRIYPDLPRTHMSGCPSCGKNRGYGIDGVTVVRGVEYICNCHDQLQRHKHYLNAGIGSTYQYLDWADYVGNPAALEFCASWVESMSSNVESGKGFYLYSSANGTGKTMLAALTLKACVMDGYNCYMTTFQNMLSSMKSGWKDAEYDKWYKGKIDSAQVLLIDDLGKEMVENSQFNREFARQTLDSLLRTRVQQGRPTLFTSNFPPNGLSQYYGMAVTSLLSECVVPVEVCGSDYRPQYCGKVKGGRRIY